MLSELHLGDLPLRRLFGLDVAALTVGDVVGHCERAIAERRRLMIGVLNAAKVVNLCHDELLRDSLLECDLLVADGQSVVWASRVLGEALPERAAGIDIFVSLLDLAHEHGHRVYLLGATQEVLDVLLQVVAERWPGLVLAGSCHGYFDAGEAPVVAAQIRAAEPDLLFLGITSPKKEVFLGEHRDALGVPVLHGVGGSFDVLAGVTRRAPELWQRAGMEWAYRLLQEPRRLWKRYLRTNTAFLALTWRELREPRPAYTQAEPVVPETPMVPGLTRAVAVPATPAALDDLPSAAPTIARPRRADQAGLPTVRPGTAPSDLPSTGGERERSAG